CCMPLLFVPPAVVLVCLLQTAFGQVFFPWNPSDVAQVNPNSNTGSVCNTDQGSCGCCLMLQNTEKMSTYFTMTLDKIEKEYLQTMQSFETIEASRTAFSVALFSDSRFQCYGPFAINQVIPYKHVFINLGGGYSTNTGIFTVPHSGVYSLALTVYSDAGAPGNKLAVCAGLQVNGQVVAGSRDQNTNDQEDSATIAVALHLKAGDQVAVRLPATCFLCDDNSHYNTFSGFLLYLTE
ncbi:hypothetical protein L3Q82_019060, partial [Scortum barcoo]